MVELVSTLISFVVFAFIIFSTYSSRKAQFAQRQKAYELKEAHMKKSMDMIRTEISLIEKEIHTVKSRFEELDDISG
ncbi:hypothetical protein [Maridesulfovibrio sp. FT414]|uniref:hypothetical protein n=1 Tax=Maridesulfovibrio sp. FT414 TaxID=2979469 RepID=UPI003D809336